MVKVRVSHIPIRYDNKTYRVGDVLDIDKETYKMIKDFVEIAEEQTKKSKSREEQMIEYLESLSYNDLKAYIKSKGVSIGKLRKHDEILEFAKKELV